MYSLSAIQDDLKITFIAMINQHQLRNQGMQIPLRINWPEPDHRKTISDVTLAAFHNWFQTTFPADADVSPFCPASNYRYEVATSGSTAGVYDLKISPRLPGGASGPTVFNYHVMVVTPLPQ